jgi:nitrogenase-associated protein
MSTVIFYEKPGCINNKKQKALLLEAGHQVQPENLLTTPWTKKKLRPFFGNLPVNQWFNYSAPRIKSGDINPEFLDENTALELMLTDPLLIRRPLIQVGNVLTVGFNLEQINAWIGLKSEVSGNQDLETCPRIQAY